MNRFSARLKALRLPVGRRFPSPRPAARAAALLFLLAGTVPANAQFQGHRAAFVVVREIKTPFSKTPRQIEDIYLVDLGALEEKRLTPDLHLGVQMLESAVASPEFDQSGTKIVFSSRRVIPDPGAERWDRYAEIWPSARGQASYTDEMYYYAVAWSHWPEYLWKLANRNWGVYSTDLKNGHETPITLFHWDELNPQWIAGGPDIAYSLQAETGRVVLRSENRENGKWTQWVHVNDEAIQPAVSPSGTRIAYQSSSSGQWDLFVKTTEGDPRLRTTKRLSFTNGANEIDPQWLPDETAVFFQSNRRNVNFYDFWKVDISSGEASPLYNSSAPSQGLNVARTDPVLSPDGAQAAFSRRGAGGWDLAVLDLATLQERTLVTGADNRLPAWSREGGVIAFISNRSGTPALYAVPASGGQPVKVSERPAAWKRPALF